MTRERTLQWLGEVEGRIVVLDPVTPAERIAAKVRRTIVDNGEGWTHWPTRRAERPVARAVRRKVQHLRAVAKRDPTKRPWTAERIRERAHDHIIPWARRQVARGVA